MNRCSFATEVISPEIDYRFEHQANTYKATTVPSHVEKLCLQVAEHEDLTLAGFDFRVTKDGRWYCLEVNPMPTFLPYEMATGQPIGNAVLDALLAKPSPDRFQGLHNRSRDEVKIVILLMRSRADICLPSVWHRDADLNPKSEVGV